MKNKVNNKKNLIIYLMINKKNNFKLNVKIYLHNK
jgi:hypothetical protein